MINSVIQSNYFICEHGMHYANFWWHCFITKKNEKLSQVTSDPFESALNVTRKKMKINMDTDMYHTKTLRKLGQIGKHVQHSKPMMRHVVMRWENFLLPS